MTNIIEYIDDPKINGRFVSEINPGSDEIAFPVEKAMKIATLLKGEKIAILGGDIFSEDNKGSLIYAYLLWGSEYHCLNWYCDIKDNEPLPDYIKRSFIVAKEKIETANDIAIRLNKKCYVSIII